MDNATEERETMIQKGLSDWWCEETEHVFQSIGGWAALARGYNRLRSQRWSKNRQMSEDSRSTSMSRFYNLRRSRRKTCPEENRRINRYDTFDYRSNGKLDSNCLDTYWYDHSIYFKTIGDIRNIKKAIGDQGKTPENVDRSFERNANPIGDRTIPEKVHDYEYPSNIDEVREGSRTTQNVWPIVDLSKLDLMIKERDE